MASSLLLLKKIEVIYMKAIFTFIFLVFFCNLSESYAQRGNVGVKGGFHTSELNFELENLISNYELGVYSYYDLNRRFTIQGELNYLFKNVTILEDKLTTKELQFPVLLKYKVFNPFYIQTGFQYNVITSTQYNDIDTTDNSMPNYFSAFLGLGIGLPSGFEFSTRCYFLDFVKKPTVDAFAASAIHVSIGFDIY